jgi:exonuclease III
MHWYCRKSYRPTLWVAKLTDTNDSGRVLEASAHLLSRALVIQSASERWCMKYSVTASVNKTSYICATRPRSCRSVYSGVARQGLQLQVADRIQSRRDFAAIFRYFRVVNVWAPTGHSTIQEDTLSSRKTYYYIFCARPSQNIILAGDFNSAQEKADCKGEFQPRKSPEIKQSKWQQRPSRTKMRLQCIHDTLTEDRLIGG